MTFDLISSFPWTQNYVSKIPLDFGSSQDECHILATYWGVWVTVEAVQAKFAGGSFDSICKQPSEVDDWALEGSNSYLHHENVREGSPSELSFIKPRHIYVPWCVEQT